MHEFLTLYFVPALGLFGGFCFAWCGVPLALRTWRDRFTFTPLSTSSMIFFGAIAMYAYLFLTYGFNWLLTLNYSVEIVSWGVVFTFGLRSHLRGMKAKAGTAGGRQSEHEARS